MNLITYCYLNLVSDGLNFFFEVFSDLIDIENGGIEITHLLL